MNVGLMASAVSTGRAPASRFSIRTPNWDCDTSTARDVSGLGRCGRDTEIARQPRNLSGFVLCPVIRSERGRPLSMIFGFGCLQRCGTVCCVFYSRDQLQTSGAGARRSIPAIQPASSVVGRGSKSLVDLESGVDYGY